MRDPADAPSPALTSDIEGRSSPSDPDAGTPGPGSVTRLLADLGRGDASAEELLFQHLYEELRILAHARLRSEQGNVTLSTTGLVHEAYLKLAPLGDVAWRDRSHFFATAARAMRRVLIDRARSAGRLKRGEGRRPAHLTAGVEGSVPDPVAVGADELLALDEALIRLGGLNPRQLRVVELRFFAGLSVPETADVLDVAVNTVKRDWSTARAWLNRELAG